jgi:hypothetical protein
MLYTVNHRGRLEIRKLIAAVSKYPATDEAVNAYAQDVEASLERGEGPTFEIRATHSKTGNPVTLAMPISGNGWDAHRIEY